MTTYLYTRTSTDRQETSNQVIELQRRFPDATVIEETASGMKHRPKLDTIHAALLPGDTLVAYSLDRLARSSRELLNLIHDLTERQINLVTIRESLDLSTAIGRLMVTMLAGFAQFEREVLGLRVKMALQAKKDQGIKLGRPTLFSTAQADEVKQLSRAGFSHRKIASQVGLHYSCVYRILKNSKE